MRVNFRDEDFILRGIGIDNGTTQVGMSVFDYDLRSNTLTVIHTEAYNPGDDAYEVYPYIEKYVGKTKARVMRIRDWFKDRLEEFNPHVVGCESPFAHIHPPAYAALLMSIGALEEVCIDYSPSLEFIKVPPGTAKKEILHGGLKYNNDKEIVRQAILTHPSIRTALLIDLKLISADESDSIAVGYCVARRLNHLNR